MSDGAEKSGLAQAATGFAILLAVSIGLCGANILAFAMSNGRGPTFLTFTAYAEVVGMGVGAAGLLVVGLIAVVRAIFFRDTTGR